MISRLKRNELRSVQIAIDICIRTDRTYWSELVHLLPREIFCLMLSHRLVVLIHIRAKFDGGKIISQCGSLEHRYVGRVRANIGKGMTTWSIHSLVGAAFSFLQ